MFSTTLTSCFAWFVTDVGPCRVAAKQFLFRKLPRSSYACHPRVRACFFRACFSIFFQLFEQGKYQDAVTLLNKLLRELKRMDDKQLLVETHLVEARVHNALRNTPKAKAALTAARTAGNSIYIAPIMQVNYQVYFGSIEPPALCNLQADGRASTR